MAIYKEKKEKLNLNVSNSNNEVKISVDCYNGTTTQVSIDTGSLVIAGCSETKVIEKASFLKGKTLEFSCAANNPDSNQIKVIHKIFEAGGNEITYIFPDDYTGEPAYDKNDDNPSYTFYVNFI